MLTSSLHTARQRALRSASARLVNGSLVKLSAGCTHSTSELAAVAVFCEMQSNAMVTSSGEKKVMSKEFSRLCSSELLKWWRRFRSAFCPTTSVSLEQSLLHAHAWLLEPRRFRRNKLRNQCPAPHSDSESCCKMLPRLLALELRPGYWRPVC